MLLSSIAIVANPLPSMVEVSTDITNGAADATTTTCSAAAPTDFEDASFDGPNVVETDTESAQLVPASTTLSRFDEVPGNLLDFTLFPKLVPELRLMIWEHSMEPRIIPAFSRDATINPAILRRTPISRLKKCMNLHDSLGDFVDMRRRGKYWFHPGLDTLFFANRYTRPLGVRLELQSRLHPAEHKEMVYCARSLAFCMRYSGTSGDEPCIFSCDDRPATEVVESPSKFFYDTELRWTLSINQSINQIYDFAEYCFTEFHPLREINIIYAFRQTSCNLPSRVSGAYIPLTSDQEIRVKAANEEYSTYFTNHFRSWVGDDRLLPLLKFWAENAF